MIGETENSVIMGRVLYVIVVSIQCTDSGCRIIYMICKNQLNALLKFAMAI